MAFISLITSLRLAFSPQNQYVNKGSILIGKNYQQLDAIAC